MISTCFSVERYIKVEINLLKREIINKIHKQITNKNVTIEELKKILKYTHDMVIDLRSERSGKFDLAELKMVLKKLRQVKKRR